MRLGTISGSNSRSVASRCARPSRSARSRRSVAVTSPASSARFSIKALTTIGDVTFVSHMREDMLDVGNVDANGVEGVFAT